MSEKLEDQMGNTPEESSSTLAWFLTGAIIGAAIAILYAPNSGKDTREFLAEKTQQGKVAVTEASLDVVEASKDMFDRGRKLVEDAADLFERGRKLVRG
jgi:gas vesicle protein